jgi:hypothetical protein
MASRPDAVSRRAFTADSASGVILFVRHSALDRLVAVKGLPAWSLVSEAGRRRAEREAMGVAERSMKRLTGESIKRMLFRGEALDEGDLEYLRQVRDEFAEWPPGSNPPQALWFRASAIDAALSLAGIHGRRLEAAEAGAGIDAALLLAEQAVAAQIIDSARRRLDELAGG